MGKGRRVAGEKPPSDGATADAEQRALGDRILEGTYSRVQTLGERVAKLEGSRESFRYWFPVIVSVMSAVFTGVLLITRLFGPET